MNTRSLVAPVLILGALAVSSAMAGRGSLMVTCTGELVDNDSTLPKGEMASHNTTSSTELHDMTIGVLDDGDSFQCSFIVPQDYVATGDPAVMRFYTWVPPSQVCGIVACTTANDVTFDMWWRNYTDSSATGISESKSETTNTKQLTGEACAALYCFEDEDMYAFSADILSDASEWAKGDLIVVRPERQDGVDDHAQEFWVWLGAVEIEYPN